MHDLTADGNSGLPVDHDTEILRDADWVIEMEPGSGSNGTDVRSTVATYANIHDDLRKISTPAIFRQCISTKIIRFLL